MISRLVTPTMLEMPGQFRLCLEPGGRRLLEACRGRTVTKQAFCGNTAEGISPEVLDPAADYSSCLWMWSSNSLV
jgi:hypothetical protein